MYMDSTTHRPLAKRFQPEVEALLTAHGFVNVEKRYPEHDNVLYVNSNYSCASKTLI